MKKHLLGKLVHMEIKLLNNQGLCPMVMKAIESGKWTLEEFREIEAASKKVGSYDDPNLNLRELLEKQIELSLEFIESPQLREKILTGIRIRN